MMSSLHTLEYCMTSAESPANSKFPDEKRNATALGRRTDAWMVEGKILLSQHRVPRVCCSSRSIWFRGKNGLDGDHTSVWWAAWLIKCVFLGRPPQTDGLHYRAGEGFPKKIISSILNNATLQVNSAEWRWGVVGHAWMVTLVIWSVIVALPQGAF